MALFGNSQPRSGNNHARKFRSTTRLRALWSWLTLLSIAVLLCVLALVQYRWIGQVSEAENVKLKDALQTSLSQIRGDFDSRLGAACSALSIEDSPGGAGIRGSTGIADSAHNADNTKDQDGLRGYASRYAQWRSADPANAKLFRRVGFLNWQNGRPEFHLFNPRTSSFAAAAWPAEWSDLKERLLARGGDAQRGRGTAQPGPGAQSAERRNDSTTIAIPQFRRLSRSAAEGSESEDPRSEENRPERTRYGRNRTGQARTEQPGTGQGRPDFGFARNFERGNRGATDWLLVEVDPHYAAGALLPELLTRYLGADYASQYDVNVAFRNNPADLVFHSSTNENKNAADASIPLFDVASIRGDGRRGVGSRRPDRSQPDDARVTASVLPVPPPDAFSAPPRSFGGPGGAGNGGRARWQLSIWAKAGSLENLVSQTRLRNLAVSAAIFLLLLSTIAVMVRLSRQAQRLAETEMEFVAGVSHELRTPLTVIRTAAFNLRGRISTNPAQVEQYGALIQQESEKLTAIVEQVLRFSSARTGYVIRERQPIAVNQLINESLQSAGEAVEALEDGRFSVQKRIDPGLPMILGDSLALRHAIQNLIGNAAKYGLEGGNWIGLFAQAVPSGKSTSVEIRVEDHGPGISADEQRHIFDAFFRGEKAVGDQVHGTGLGLNLVKRIVEAHGGTVAVESEPGAGASFIVTLPAAPLGYQT